MAGKPQGKGNLDAAEDKLAATLKPMDIKAVPYAKIASHRLKAHLFLQEILLVEKNHRHPAAFFQQRLLLARDYQSLSQRKRAQDPGPLRAGAGHEALTLLVAQPAANKLLYAEAFLNLMLQRRLDHG